MMNNRKKILIRGGILLLLSILLVIIPADNPFIEKYYTYGIFPYISGFLRTVFGSISISVGDIIYTIFGAWLFYRISKCIYLVIRKRIKRREVWNGILNFIMLLLLIFICFNILWGLNYKRQGIDRQFQLNYNDIQPEDYLKMLDITIAQLNTLKSELVKKGVEYPTNEEYFHEVEKSYDRVAESYPFFKYEHPSIKPSLYGWVENYLGFTGYYNPFTGEAQANTMVPRFLIPAITVHEVAHQIGYGMEDEANFVGFFVGTHSSNELMQYSSWFDFFLYVYNQTMSMDSSMRKQTIRKLDSGVRDDLETLIRFNKDHESFMEPIYRMIYDKFLKFNEQPEGIMQYDIVVARITALYKKEGKL